MARRIIETNIQEEDLKIEGSLRPQYLKDYIGQEEVKENKDWRLLPPEESKFHDDGVGANELKFIHLDGREAVFDGDTLEPETDARYMATYNYYVLYELPQSGATLDDYVKYGWSYVMHGVADVLPYWLTGNSNTREQFEEKVVSIFG